MGRLVFLVIGEQQTQRSLTRRRRRIECVLQDVNARFQLLQYAGGGGGGDGAGGLEMSMGATTWSQPALQAPVVAAERALTAATETHRAASTAHQDELRQLERALDDARLEAAAASGRVSYIPYFFHLLPPPARVC